MIRSPGRLLANAAWFLSALPGWVRFHRATGCVAAAQRRALRRMVRRALPGRFEAAAGGDPFEALRRLPLTDYADYEPAIRAVREGRRCALTRDPVRCLQPTSGTTSAPKLIPFTAAAARELHAGLDAWIANLYLLRPGLFLATHYWSLSPNTAPPSVASDVPVGFAGDWEYLGALQRRLARRLFAAPEALSRVTDPDAFAYLTLLALARDRHLGLVSVWHPSFLVMLLDAAGRHAGSIAEDVRAGTLTPPGAVAADLRSALLRGVRPDARRAGELEAAGFGAAEAWRAVWPRLQVISCWTGGTARAWVETLVARFPGVLIQGKGLVATEGLVSIPFGRQSRTVCAVTSHVVEFEDLDGRTVRGAWELEVGREYRVVLTTGAGLTRYRLGDVVRVNGFVNRAPCLEFRGREGGVSDLVGEKVHPRQVREVLERIEQACAPGFQFALVAPVETDGAFAYTLFAEPRAGAAFDGAAAARALEEGLRANYHYCHARGLRQLDCARAFRIVGGGAEAYRRRRMAQGVKAGDVKFEPLSPDRDWQRVFDGGFEEARR